MASNTTNGETKEIRDNLFIRKNVSSDNNANPSKACSNMKSTGAIPKAKAGSGSIANGISAEARVKLNNNVHESAAKAEVNGTEPYANAYLASEVDAQPEAPAAKAFGKSLTNGLKGLSRPYCTKSSDSSSESPAEAALNGADCAPSTSHAFPNIRLGAARQSRDSDSEYSSDTGNDDLSCSDECCIYTYKGDAADLPRSFLHMDTHDNNDAPDHSRAGSRGSSPEMDFLEMDFDPGPSCDADSDASSVRSELRSDENAPDTDSFEQPQPAAAEGAGEPRALEPAPALPSAPCASPPNNLGAESAPAPQKQEPELHNHFVPEQKQARTEPAAANLVDEPWVPKVRSQRTQASAALREAKGYHSSSGDLVSPHEGALPSTSAADGRVNTSSSLYHSTMEKQLVLDKQPAPAAAGGGVARVARTMIWTEPEAAQRQITQIGTSACGATAVLNVLAALGQPVPTHDRALAAVTTRSRANGSPLVPYLRSRSVAGSTHKDLIAGLAALSQRQVYARFFHMHPERYLSLSLWLNYWIQKGAVPIATLNLQKGVVAGQVVPDAWHHQMIFGVDAQGIYLTNPLERVEEGELWPQLSSESVLLVRREDVTARWNDRTNLRELMMLKDVRWHNMNVLGQVANVVREHQRLVRPHAVSRTHVSIPAAYSAGVTLAMNASSPACELLRLCPELPLLNELP